MKKFFALISAVVMAASLGKCAAFAEFPDNLPEDLAALVIVSKEEPADGVEMLPKAVLKDKYAGKSYEFNGRTYSEFKAGYMDGTDGVISKFQTELGSRRGVKLVWVYWYAAEKETNGRAYARLGYCFKFDEASGRYIHNGNRDKDLLDD